MKKLLALIMIVFLSFGVFANEEEEHALSTITGTNINLQIFDHAFAGSINGVVAWGFLDESIFTSELIIRKYLQTIKTQFKKTDAGIGGEIIRMDGEKEVKTTIKVGGIDGENLQIKLLINGEEVTVQISHEGFEGGHFKNPTYSTVLNGEPVQFTLKGEACFGLSLHLSMMIFGTYVY